MLTKKFWLRLFNVDQGEWWIVKNLMILQFLQGAGIAFFFTASFASFLDTHGIKELPWVMIASAFLLWVTGFIYTKAEHALPFPKLVIGVTLLIAAMFILFRVFGYTSIEGNFLYWMLASFHALYLLNNLQFWGIATIVFDLRQSKRLFGLISSGDIPAKFVGYTMALLIVDYTGAMNLLYLGAGFMVASIPFLLRIIRSGKIHVAHHGHHKGHHHPGHHEDHHAVHHGNKLVTLLKNFLSNAFIRDIAFISMLAFMCILIIDFGFYSEIKYGQKDDKDLAKFIAFFMATLRISALAAKMIFTGRLTNSLGIRQTLLITPIVTMVLVFLLIASQWLSSNEKLIFYLFGTTFIIVDVCRTVFNSPVLLTLMQPLPTHERLRAHNIVKGIMDPFAYLITGSLLLLLIKVQQGVNLMTYCYVILGVLCLWIPGIFVVNRRYLNILVQTISSRYFSQEEFTLKDEAIVQAIRRKIDSGNDLEVISILKMLHSKKDPVAVDLLAQLLDHRSAQVQLETLRLITGQQTESLRPRIMELVKNDENPEVRLEAIRALGKNAASDSEMQGFTSHGNDAVRRAALSGMLMNADGFMRRKAEGLVDTMIRGDRKEEKFFAAGILTDVRDQFSHPWLHDLIADADPDVRTSALGAIGKAADAKALTALINIIPLHTKPAFQALQDAGDRAVPHISEVLKEGKHPEYREKLIALLGRIGGKPAQEALAGLLEGDPLQLPPVIRALYRTRYRATAQVQHRMEALTRMYLIYGVELLHMQKLLHQQGGYDMLERSIALEIREIRDLLLCLFACMFDRVKMNQARKGLDSNINENIANAMELIELTVKKDIGRYFNHMFETTSIEHRCDALRALLKDIDFSEVEHIVSRILTAKPIHYQNWTQACSLYLTRKHLFKVDPVLIRQYSTADNQMVRETAEFALANQYI